MKIRINPRQAKNIRDIITQLEFHPRATTGICLNRRFAFIEKYIDHEKKCAICYAITPELLEAAWESCPCFLEDVANHIHIKRLTKILKENPNV